MNKINGMMIKGYLKFKNALNNEKGAGEDEFNWVRNIGIGIIIGAAILAILKVALPDLFNSIISKIKSVFEL